MVTKNSGRPRRKRSFSVKTQAFTLIEERLEDMGWTFKNTSEIYDHLVEETHLSLDTIRNFFNPQWKRYPEKKTVETIAALLNIKPCDLVQDWIVPEEENSDDTLNQEVILARSLFEKMLDKQRYLTSNLLINANLERSNVYVPLELVERKEISRHKEVKVERGADLYRPQHYENTRAIQMSQFLEEVIGKGNSPKSQGKRIAIIGEPGSGKTTRLQEVADWLLRENDGNLVIWISLADLQGETLEEFLLDVWLKIALERTTTDALSHEALVRKFKEGNVWLLLDGLDEMGIDGSPLSWLDSQLQGWISWAKVILTCRLNLWDGGRQPLYNFDVYQNCDFSDVQRDEFIRKFFNDTELSAGLIEKLNKPGKERIRNLARNPLRLTLICHSWCKRQGSLPETKAGLYKECVDAYYDWKEKPKVTGEQRKQLNKALGELAKQALEDRNYRFRITYDRASNILGDADEGLFKLALELGWLNQVGVASENPGEKIYAFLHPSFQEYFAAAVIEDGAYFMPDDPDNLEGYRIFDNNLKEVASYWLERDDIDQKSKEAVIDGLLNFNSGNVGLHAYSDNLVYTLYEDRAYSIALELVSYQPKIYLKPSILEQITEIIYNHVFNDDKYSQFAVKTTWIYKDCLAKLSVNLKLNILHYLLNDLRYDDNGVKYEYINKLTITGSISNQDRQILNKCLDLVIKHQPYLQLVFIARTLDNIDDKLKVQSLLRNIIYSSKDKVQDEEYYIYLCCWSLELLEKSSILILINLIS
ncbi:MAG: hypothetical protein N5P05_004470 (plasmid) [Chroococcopsis gigantea SAG 12.99]|nr:hypothetical protein [Chroococcopsis gigantea SAG 12.99]